MHLEAEFGDDDPRRSRRKLQEGMFLGADLFLEGNLEPLHYFSSGALVARKLR